MPTIQVPTVAAITLHATGGGVAVVSQLLWHVVQDEWRSQARLLTMFDHESRPATLIEKARYTALLTRAQALGRTDWILFTHLALAKIQKSVPAPLRRPYAVFLHGIEAWRRLSANEKQALAQADLRIANSCYTAARVAEAHPDVGPIVACPLALPPSSRVTSGGSPAQALGPHAVLVVGRMNRNERYKGHDELIDAWPLVVEKVPDAQLVIAGSGDDAKRLMEKAAAGRAGRHIQFTGFVSSATLDSLYQSAALFALPSRGEGFGLVYLEAMARRLPCIGSIHDAAGEVIVDGETGRLVDQRDIAGLGDTIAALLLDEDNRRRMGAAGYSRLTTEFTFEGFRDRIRGLLHVALAASAAAAV